MRGWTVTDCTCKAFQAGGAGDPLGGMSERYSRSLSAWSAPAPESLLHGCEGSTRLVLWPDGSMARNLSCGVRGCSGGRYALNIATFCARWYLEVAWAVQLLPVLAGYQDGARDHDCEHACSGHDHF